MPALKPGKSAALILWFAGSLFGEVTVRRDFTLIDDTGKPPDFLILHGRQQCGH